MNNLDVKLKIEKMFARENDFEFRYISGDGDCSDTFSVKFLGETYKEGYKCLINISLNLNSGMWDVDVNGFHILDFIDNEIELEFAIRQQMKFARTPCSDQLIAEYQSDQSVELYY